VSEAQPDTRNIPAEQPAALGGALLDVRDLCTVFETASAKVRAVDGVSLRIDKGAAVAVVGESGSGKSVTSLSILRLLPSPPGRIERGQVLFQGRDLVQAPERELRALRGKRIAMIFQEPMTSLNPVYTVGQQIGEVLQLHEGMERAAARARAVELLKLVGIPAPESRVDAYPHELSGGMRQRVMIAMAIACRPELLIADEPTTALDVTIQAQILDLLARLRRELGMSILLITHDLGVVAEFVDEVFVMYAGRVVEHARTQQLFEAPLHPYTKGLLASVPGALGGTAQDSGKRRRLATIEGVVPDLAHLPAGCRFRDRCPEAIAICAERDPELTSFPGDRQAACHVARQAHGSTA
jgi:peptide/nickel transport system ATP-binding protein